METLFIPNENDFRQWVKEAVKECLEDINMLPKTIHPGEEPFISRDEVASLLNISLVTLTDWMKRGLPYHKQRGRVYYLRSEVQEYIRSGRKGTYSFSRRMAELGK
jgi:predicted DNA-binding transcriptional regulator AlpA